MKKKLEKEIVFAFLSSKYKLLTLNTIARESNIHNNIVHRFLQNSNLIERANKRTRRGEILYYLTDEAKSIYKLEKKDFSFLFQPIKQLLSEGNLNEAIKEFYEVLKNNENSLSSFLTQVYK